MSRWYRYIAHAAVPAWEAIGWRSLGPVVGPGGFYSTLMRFDGETPPELPHAR